MPHVLVVGPIHPAGLDLLRASPGVTAETVEAVTAEDYTPRLPDADALLIRTQPVPRSAVASAPRLKIVSRHGVGTDAVDVGALDERCITLSIVGDVNSRPVAEHAFALLLALAKQVTAYDAATRGTGWETRNAFSSVELWGKTLFVVGFGRIGRIVAGMAAGFGMQVLAYDPFLDAGAIEAAGAIPVGSLAEGLQRADTVTLHVPKAEGGPLLGRDELALLKPEALIVNTARGDLIDADALADALETGTVRGAGLDVFAQEPPSRASRLLRSGRTILSPHAAALTRECAVRMSEVAAQNILDFFAGRLDPRLVVNRARA